MSDQVTPVQHPDWEFRAGDTWSITFNCQNSDGSAFDLTGATVVWKLTDRLNLVNELTFTNNVGLVVPVPINGAVYITVDAINTFLLPPESYFDELTVIKGGTHTMAVGAINVVEKLR